MRVLDGSRIQVALAIALDPTAGGCESGERVGFSDYITGGRVVYDDVIKFRPDQQDVRHRLQATAIKRERTLPGRH